MNKDFRPEFIIVPYQLMEDEQLQPVDLKIFGVIYWFERLKDGRCTASNEAIAKYAKVSEGTVANSLIRLEERGYIRRFFEEKEKSHRTHITCLLSFSGSSSNVPGSSDSEPTGSSNSEQNNNILNNKITTNVVISAKAPKKQVQEINLLLDYLKSKLGSQQLDGSVTQNRQFAWLCLKKFCNTDPPDLAAGLENTKKIINLAFRDPFHAARCTEIKYIYYNGMKIISTAKEKLSHKRGKPIV